MLARFFASLPVVADFSLNERVTAVTRQIEKIASWQVCLAFDDYLAPGELLAHSLPGHPALVPDFGGTAVTRRRIPYLSSHARWALLALALLCGGALLLLVSATAFDKDSALWARWLLLLAMLGSIVAALATSDFRMRRDGLVRSILEPRNVAILFLAILTGFGAATDAVNLFLPRAAVEPEPYALYNTVAATRVDTSATRKAVERLAGEAEAARIREKLPGRWGEQEPACGLVWRMEIRGDALIAEIVRRPPGVEPYRFVGRITGARGDEMDVTGEEPAQARGDNARFRYSFDGATERLVWDDQRRASDLQEYRRCP